MVTSPLTYRLASRDEWDIVADWMASHGMMLPPPEVSSVAVAHDDDGMLHGAWVVQIGFFLEPLVTDSDAKHPVNLHKLMRAAEGALAHIPKVRYYIHVGEEEEQKVKLLGSVGVRPSNFRILYKDLDNSDTDTGIETPEAQYAGPDRPDV